MLVVVTACSTTSPSSSPSSPPPPPTIESADLGKLSVDPASGFTIRFEGDDRTVAVVKKYEGDKSSRYDVWRWDPTWPNDADSFLAKLKQPDFIDEQYRYDVAKTSATDDAWEFRGNIIRAHDVDPPEATFVLVRTINGKRFVCLGRRVTTDWAMSVAIASCRAAKLSLRQE